MKIISAILKLIHISEYREEANLTGLLLSLLWQTRQNKIDFKTPIYVILHLNSTKLLLVTSSQRYKCTVCIIL